MMPLHRRHVAGNAQDQKGSTLGTDFERRDENDDGRSFEERSLSSSTSSPLSAERPRRQQQQQQQQQQRFLILVLIGLQSFLLVLAVRKAHIQSASQLVAVLLAALATSFPAVVSLAMGLGVGSSPSDLWHQRYIPMAVTATIVGNQLPVYLSSGMAAMGIWIFGLASRPIPQGDGKKTTTTPLADSADTSQDRHKHTQRSRQSMSGPLKTVLAILAMIATLLTENFFVWVVSATYKPSQQLNNLPAPLQDNGQITMHYIFNQVLQLSKRDVVTLRNMINVEWILVSSLGLSLVAIEMQGAAMRRNLWSMALRGVLTMAVARFIRTVSFLITVLPSQNPHCYFSHFPNPPPEEWAAWLMVGFTPQVNGGCNDLIISGHATVTSTLACVVTSIVGKPMFTAALWMLVSMDYMVEVYEGFHYSVDMWLGALMVNFIWTVLAPLENPASSVPSGGGGGGRGEEAAAAKKFYPLSHATGADMVRYFLPAFGSYVQVVGLIPKSLGNYTIVSYVGIVIYQISRHGFQQDTQHVLFCLLFMALGLYL